MDLEKRNKSEYFLKNNFHKKKVSDGGLVMCEIYNPNFFTVIMKIQPRMIKYIIDSGITLGPSEIVIKHDSFAILTHQYYYATGVGLPDGEPINMIINYGNMIGVGNKFQSRPE